MSPEKKAQVVAFIQRDIGGFVDAMESASSMPAFKQWVKAEALYSRQRKVAKAVDELGLDISPASTATLHEHDIPAEG